MIGPFLTPWMQSLALDMQQSHQLQQEPEGDEDKEASEDQSADKPSSSQSSPSMKEAKGKSPLKKMAKLKKRAQGELFNAAIEKVTSAQHASDQKFLEIEEKRLKMEEKMMGQ